MRLGKHIHMRAVRAHGSSVDDLRYELVPHPRVKPGWLLVRVHAVGVDADELLWPSTWSTEEGLDRAPSTLGRDVSGVVVEAGGDSTFRVGDDVFGMVDSWHDGATADFALVRHDDAVRKPLGMSHADAASMPSAAMVALRMVDMLAGSITGRRLLVDGRPDAVALLTIQLARRAGFDVIGTGSRSDAQYLAYFGASEVVDESPEEVLDAARTVDMILSTRGSDRASWLQDESQRPVATPSSPLVAPSSSANQPTTVLSDPSQPLLRRLASIVESEPLRAPLAFALPMAQARDVYEWSLRNANRIRGKAVLEPIEDIAAYEIDPILELVAEAEARA